MAWSKFKDSSIYFHIPYIQVLGQDTCQNQPGAGAATLPCKMDFEFNFSILHGYFVIRKVRIKIDILYK